MYTHNHALRSSTPDTMALKLFTVAAFLLFSLMLGQSAWADNDNDDDDDGNHERDLIIIEVLVTFEDAAYGGIDTITIKGEDFDFGKPPTVRLGSFPDPLVVLYASDTQIIVECPTTIGGTICPSGDYLLRLSTGKGKSKNDEWDLTIVTSGADANLVLVTSEGVGTCTYQAADSQSCGNCTCSCTRFPNGKCTCSCGRSCTASASTDTCTATASATCPSGVLVGCAPGTLVGSNSCGGNETVSGAVSECLADESRSCSCTTPSIGFPGTTGTCSCSLGSVSCTGPLMTASGTVVNALCLNLE
jgi:hypothetical protein